MTGAIRAFRERYGRVLEWLVSALMIVLAVEVTRARYMPRMSVFQGVARFSSLR